MSTENATGRVAVITGASSGIGEATARVLAAAGHRIALLARRRDRIQALADQLGSGAIAIQADVTDRGSIVAAAQRVQDELGGADILINNAGVMLLGPFSPELSEDYRRMVETNLLGAITTTDERLVGVAAPAVAARRARDRHRTRRGRDQARRAHHPRRDQGGGRGDVPGDPRSVSLNEILVRPTAQAL